MKQWLFSVIDVIRNIFKKKPSESTAAIPKPPNNKTVTVGFVIGHNRSSQGAVNYEGKTEFRFSSQVAIEIESLLVNSNGRIKVVAIERPTGSYSKQCKAVASELKNIGADFSIHSHFNSAPGGAIGFESLYANYSELKQCFHNTLVNKLCAKDRGLKRAIRGRQMLAATHCPSIIIEWCFGNHRHKQAREIFDDVPRCARLLVETIEEVL